MSAPASFLWGRAPSFHCVASRGGSDSECLLSLYSLGFAGVGGGDMPPSSVVGMLLSETLGLTYPPGHITPASGLFLPFLFSPLPIPKPSDSAFPMIHGTSNLLANRPFVMELTDADSVTGAQNL